jgi:soluble lytic murein transglycosylase-like protein
VAVFVRERGSSVEPGDDALYTATSRKLDSARSAGDAGKVFVAMQAIAGASYFASQLKDPELRSQAQAAIAATWSEILARNRGAAYGIARDALDALAAKIADAPARRSWATAVDQLWSAISAGQDNLTADELEDLRARHEDLLRKVAASNPGK